MYACMLSHFSHVQLFCQAPLSMEGFPASSNGKDSACKVGDPGLIPGSGRSPPEGHGNPLQYSCPGLKESDTTDQLTLHFCPWDSPGKNTGVGCHAPSRGSSQPRDQMYVYT